SSRSPSDTSASPHLYPASLHDALPISIRCIRYRFERELRRNLHAIANIAQTLAGNRRIHGHQQGIKTFFLCALQKIERGIAFFPDRKSTRLNSSHVSISYAVCCLSQQI